MPAPPLRSAISGTPTNATANAGLGALWDYVTGLLGATGNAPEARTALGIATQAIGDASTNVATDAFVQANQRSPIQSVTATVAANAMTVGLQPTVLDFRSATLTTGAPLRRTVSTALSLVIPSGASLGTVNAVASRIVLLAIDNAGTVELAVTNISGGLNLDETSLINTTAISAAATAANVVYSTTARTGVAFRVVGFVDSTQATAGTWATTPSLVQGQGGQALTALQSAGMGQTWQNVTGSRTAGVTYYNTTGKPIQISIFANVGSGSASGSVSLTIGALSLGQVVASGLAQIAGTATFLVPPGVSYSFTQTGVVSSVLFYELR